MANNPNIILGAGQGRPESVDYNSARNIVQAGAALQSKQEQQDLQRSMQAQSAFQSALQQSGGDYDKAIAQSEQQGYDMTPVRASRAKLQEQIYKAGQEQLNQHKTEDDLIGRVFNTMDASDPVSIQTGTQMLMRIDPHGGWDQIVGQNPTKEHLAQLGGLGMTAKEHADLAAKSLESMKVGDWMGYLAAGKKSSNSPEDWQQVTALGQRLGIAPEMISHVDQMTHDQLDEVLKVKPTKETAAKVGSFEDYVTRTYGENPTPAQILAARKAYGQADDRPRVSVSVAPTAAPGTTFEDLAKGTGMSPTAIKIASQRYLEDGTLPTRINEKSKQAILNGAALITPDANVASNVAQYGADRASLKNTQGILDSIQAFHPAALANLKQFDALFSKIPDTGSPFFNAPVRSLDRKMFGADNVLAAQTAVAVATREIARITSNPKLTGQLSDHAREEVSNFLPQDATLKEARDVMNVLKTDLDNVEKGQRDQLGKIQYRLSHPGQAMPEGNDALTVKAPNGKTYKFTSPEKAAAFKKAAGIS